MKTPLFNRPRDGALHLHEEYTNTEEGTSRKIQSEMAVQKNGSLRFDMETPNPEEDTSTKAEGELAVEDDGWI